jgi:hypothetical protein
MTEDPANVVGRRGIIYVAWGEEYVREAISSAAQVRSTTGYSCVLVTGDKVPVAQPFDAVINVPFSRTYRDKIAMRLSPFEYTIFLDTDTRVLGSLDPLFALLERFDVFFQPADGGLHYSIPGIPMDAFPEPHAGIIGWRDNSRTRELFDLWEGHYDEQAAANGEGAWDQRSLRAALWRSNVRLTMLSGEWQLSHFAAAYLLGSVRVVHGRGPRVLDAVREANSIIDRRVYIPRLGCLPLNETTTRQYAAFGLRIFIAAARTAVRTFLHRTGLRKRPTNLRPM